MASTKEEFAAQWRSSAHEAVPYTEDFPECLLVIPELWDGSLGQTQGKATQIHTTFELPVKDGPGILKIRDNGQGITNLTRLLAWASRTNTDISHRYGHGSKKMLTKWSRDHETAKWTIKYRTKDKKGFSSSLHTLTGPFLGIHTKHEEDAENETTLMPSGTEWSVEFDPAILGEFCDPTRLFEAVKELYCSKYSEAHLARCQHTLSVLKYGAIIKQETSSIWLTFQQQLEKEVAEGRAIISRKKTVAIEGGCWSAIEYKLTGDGKAAYPLKQYFPTYGAKNMKAARVHIGLDGRFIEAMPLYKLLRRDSNHNDFNGRFVIVNFIPTTANDYEKLPTPCTTKVSFYENCPVFKKFQDDFGEFLKEKELDPPKPKELPPITEKQIDGMKVVELEMELGRRGLSKSGNKFELQNRLQNHLFPKPKNTVVVPPTPSTPPKPKLVLAAPLAKPFTIEIGGYKHNMTLPPEKTVESLLEHIKLFLKA
jgi:SAP domain